MSQTDHHKHKSTVQKIVLRVHRWLGLVLGVQVLLWMVSGVIMSWFHSSLVHGETHASLQVPVELVAQNFVAPGGIIAQAQGAQNLNLKNFMGQVVYVTSGNGQNHMFDALTGKKISPIDEQMARRVAANDYAGNAPIEFARLLTKTPPEYRKALPVWQVQYKDNLKTRLYISPHNGEVLSRRNKAWRLYDFFWMLHIMDYGEREDINNPLIRIFSLTGLLFAMSGLWLIVARLFQGMYIRDFRLVTRAEKNDGATSEERQ